MRVGYVRVSTVDQNTVRQLDAIKVERTFIDKVSGKDTTRPKLEEMIAFVRDGDTVIVHSMDRLARNSTICAGWCAPSQARACGSNSSRRV